MSDSLTLAERGTRLIAGKPYHWHRRAGVLNLHAGTEEACAESANEEVAAAAELDGQQ